MTTNSIMHSAAHTASPKSSSQAGDQNSVLDVTIAIVSHKHLQYMDECLSSVFANTHDVSFEVVLVDNAKDEPLQKFVRDKFPEVCLIVNETPMGFSENNNMVLCPADSRYRFLLNPDTICQPGAVDRLVQYLDDHPKVGAVGPKLLYPDGRLQLSCRRFPSVGAVLLRRTPLRRVFPNSKKAQRYEMVDWDHNDSRSVDWMFGAAIMIRAETLDQVGGLDSDLFIYCEDIDWCLRCHRAGWDVHYVADAVIHHHLDDSKYNQYFSKSRRQHYRTMIQFFLKYPKQCLRW
jgi:GT2 family glycosyltransferase